MPSSDSRSLSVLLALQVGMAALQVPPLLPVHLYLEAKPQGNLKPWVALFLFLGPGGQEMHWGLCVCFEEWGR